VCLFRKPGTEQQSGINGAIGNEQSGKHEPGGVSFPVIKVAFPPAEADEHIQD